MAHSKMIPSDAGCLKPFFPYPGGKTADGRLHLAILDNLRPLVTMGREFRELFVGAGGIFLSLAPYLPTGHPVWLNDLDSSVICLWRAVRDWPEELAHEAKRLWNPCVKLVFHMHKQTKRYCDPDGDKDVVLNQAVSKLVRQHFTRAGGKERTPVKKNKLFSTVEESLMAAHQQLARLKVRLTALHFRDVVKVRGKACMYLDPTYFVNGRKNYRKYMKVAEHTELRDLLFNCAHPWLLSYDDCAAVRRLYDVSQFLPVLKDGREQSIRVQGRTDEVFLCSRKSGMNGKTYRELLLTTATVYRTINSQINSRL